VLGDPRVDLDRDGPRLTAGVVGQDLEAVIPYPSRPAGLAEPFDDPDLSG
jgi:hypothetical protein